MILFLKGFDKFRAKLPMFRGFRIILLIIFLLFMVFSALAILQLFDRLPGILLSIGFNEIFLSLFPLFGFLFVEFIGFILVYQMWYWRDYLKAKYGITSYQKIFLIGFGGIIWVLTIAFTQFNAFYKLSLSFWDISPLKILATPLDAMLGFFVAPALFYTKSIFGIMLLIIGFLMVIRSLQVFGFDYLTVVYLYFPEESEIKESEIYSILRHPVYAAAIVISLGGAIFNLTIFSFVFFACFLAGFYIHIYFVEERELIDRFGDSYVEYRKNVPAFFINPRNLRKFLKFLLKGSKT
jgi:protein-S-isoprenylcysteine O-methyltransferase Ste14